MSQYRTHYRVTIDGVTHDVVTTAHDMAPMTPEDRTMGDMLAMVHRACVRLHVPGCPVELDRFLELVDQLDNAEVSTNGNGAALEVDPTHDPASVG